MDKETVGELIGRYLDFHIDMPEGEDLTTEEVAKRLGIEWPEEG